MGGTAAAGIGKTDILEGDCRDQRHIRLRRARRLRRHQRLGREQRVDAGGGRLPDHPLMQHHAQIAQRAEYLGAGHQHDQQRLDAHQPVRHPPHRQRQGRRGADRHPAIGDPAGHDPGRQHPQAAVAQLARPLGEPLAEGPALTEGFQRRQSLDAVEKLRAEGFERLLAALAAAALDLDKDGRRDQRHQCRDQHHRRHRHVPERDEDEDRQRRQHRDRQLRHILAEKGLQLLDAVDDRQHDAAGALAGKPGRSQLGDLVVKPAAQFLLHPRRGAVRDHRAAMLDRRRAGSPRRRRQPPAALSRETRDR